MWTTNPLTALFGKSPFGPIQQHMKIVEQCAAEVVPLFEALRDGDHQRIQQLKARIFELEEQADGIKNQIRSELPKSLFMPVDRRDLLDLLNSQDSIADSAQDVAGLIALRTMEMPEPMRDGMVSYAKRTVDAARQCGKIIGELDELLETGFRGRDADHVVELTNELGRIETDTDDQGMELTRILFGLEDELKPVSVILWYELIRHVGDIADYAEDVGDRLRLLIAR